MMLKNQVITPDLNGTSQILKTAGLFEQKEALKSALVNDKEVYSFHLERMKIIKEAYFKLEKIDNKFLNVTNEPAENIIIPG